MNLLYQQHENGQGFLFKKLSTQSPVQVLEAMGSPPGELSEELVTQEKRKKGWRMNCDVGEATEGLYNELRRR